MKKLHVRDLQVGMFVVDTGLSWLENPFLYAQEGEIASAEQVQAMLDEGFEEVFVDPERGCYVFADADGRTAEQHMADGMEVGPAEAQASQARAELHLDASELPPVDEAEDSAAGQPANLAAKHQALRKEMTQARKTYDEAMQSVRAFMDAAKDGAMPDLQASEGLIENVIDSIIRSEDALISMTKLRAFDEYTYTHSLNVSVLSVAFGKAMGLNRSLLNRLGMAGLFHDLGKQRIPSAVLNKPGKLTPEEFEVIKSHPERGFILCKGAKFDDTAVLRGIIEHHEKYNGSGYPRRLSGDSIHHFARIIAIADVYDALTSKRVYKKGMLPNKALSIMYNMRGEDFFPGLVERFIKQVGIYPVGSLVRLSDYSHGVVVTANPEAPLTPLVTVAFDERMRPRAQELLDLAGEKEAKGPKARRIIDCLDPKDYKVDVSALVA